MNITKNILTEWGGNIDNNSLVSDDRFLEMEIKRRRKNQINDFNFNKMRLVVKLKAFLYLFFMVLIIMNTTIQ